MFNSKVVFVAAAIALAGLGACSQQAAEPAQAPAAVSTELTAAAPIAVGAFEGRSDHITTGVAKIVGEPGQYTLVLAEDFELDGAPDPIVGFGNDGAFDLATSVGSLKNRTGAQTYALPASFDPAANSEVYIWCEQFSVPLGVATLQ